MRVFQGELLMKQKTKKRLITCTLIVVWLCGCYFIGQKTHPQAKESIAEEAEPVSRETSVEQNIAETKEGEAQTVIPVTFINNESVSTQEIPWGFTAGTIMLEDGSEAWLLTPGTGLRFESTNETLLRYCIHPWMKDTSNGASLQITYGENNEILTVSLDWLEYNIPATAGTVHIDVLSTDNNDGDWVAIQTAPN